MIRLPLSILALTLANLVYAETINVADHGILPGKDVTLEVNQLTADIQGKSDITLFFPKGQYEFYPDNAYEAWRAVANHDNSLRRVAIPIIDMENVTIDGGGSTFMFHGRISPVTVDNSNNVTLKNFTIDWKRPFQTEMLVVESNEKENSFVVEIDPEHYPYEVKKGELLFNHYDWQDKLGSNMTFDPATRSPIFDTRKYSLRAYKNPTVKELADNRVQFQNASAKAPPVGSVVVSYGNHPTSRLAQAIHLNHSSDLFITDVTVLAGGGMGIIADRCENITLDHFVITSRDDRMIATRADATHFIGCKGTIKLENCLFEHMLDDGINVHGAYVKVVDYIGDNTFICEISHFQQWGLTFAEAGDKIALLSRTTILPFHNTTVKSVKTLNEHRFLVEVTDLPTELPGGPLSMENLTWNPDLIMSNNIIRENRARSVLVTTKGKVLIENNTFSSQMHGILIEGDNKFWYESGAVQDITIRNNTFVNIGFENNARYPLFAAPMLMPEQKIGEGHYHRNINFIDNTLKSFNGHFVHAFSVKGLKVTGNTIELSEDYPTGSDLPSVELIYCDDVTIENNTFKGFAQTLQAKVSDDSANIRIQDNLGLEISDSEERQTAVSISTTPDFPIQRTVRLSRPHKLTQ